MGPNDTSGVLLGRRYVFFCFLYTHSLFRFRMTTTMTNSHLDTSNDQQNGHHLTLTCPTTPNSDADALNHNGNDGGSISSGLAGLELEKGPNDGIYAVVWA
jgi:hypothetical protein